MPQETLGYVEMEWTCRRCGTKNRGLTKTCAGCGAQMDADQQFEQAAEQKLITDTAQAAQAAQGPDIHCPFCGTRNAAGAARCSQCGGDLTKGEKRQAGQVVGAFQAGAAAPIKCPACAAENPAAAARCHACGRPLGTAAAAPQPIPAPAPAAPAAPAKRPTWVMAATGIAAGLLCLCVGGFLAFQLLRTTDINGQVQSVYWQRSIGIEAQADVQHSAWRDEVPADAKLGACQEKPRGFQDAPDSQRRSEKVCGTPYQVDQGNGSSKVVQDCKYQIYDDYCSYTVREWKEVDRAEAHGSDLEPYWPDVNLSADQREGDRSEKYQVTFAADQKSYDYTCQDETTFQQFKPGSHWTLKVNGLGGVNAAEPAR